MDKKQNKDLHKACAKGDAAAIKKALAAGADVNLADKKGNGPLHVAVSSGVLEACKVLLEAGADPRARNTKGMTPSEYAEDKKKKNLVQVLREYEAGGGLQTVCKASVAVYTYEAGQWKQTETALVSLELVKCHHPFSYKLVGKTTKTLIDAPLDVNFQYSKSTDMFHNFQEGAKIWGFNFASEDEAKMILAQLDIAREELRNPPPPPEVKAPAPAAAAAGPPAKTGGGPPPPPPPPSAPSPPAAPSAPAPAAAGGGPPAPPGPGPAAPAAGGAAKPLSMAEAIAAKAGGGLKAAADRPAGGSGGDLLSELSNRVKKRPVADGASPGGAAASGVPNVGQLQTFKEGLLADFREELAAARTSIIEELVAEIHNMP